MYQNNMCAVIDLFEEVEIEYNHKEFIINELRRARHDTMSDPTPGKILALLVWLDTLIHEINKESKESSLKIVA